MRRPLLPLLAATLLTAVGCAARTPAGAITRLEAKHAAHPEAGKTLRALGIAYYKADRFADARRVLASAQQLMPRDGVTALYLGMSAEATGDLPAARAAYEDYARFGRTSRVRSQLRARLAALARKQLEADAKAAVAQEATIGATAGSPRTVAVAPLSYFGTDTTFASLGRGLADLMITDLSRSSQLTIVERDRMDALLDEVARSGSGAVDSATLVRSGRLARAGRLVRGSITQLAGSALRADAAVVDVSTAQAGKPLDADFSLDAIFDAEKRIVLAVFDEMGVTLTAAERSAIEQRPTKSLAAFLSYSRGLAAEDAGRYREAQRLFEDAARIDPSFGAAQSGASRAQATVVGASLTPAAVESSLAGTSEGAVVAAATLGVDDASSLASTAQAARDAINPSPAAIAAGGATVTAAPTKEGAAIATGGDNVTLNAGRIIIQVPLPK